MLAFTTFLLIASTATARAYPKTGVVGGGARRRRDLLSLTSTRTIPPSFRVDNVASFALNATYTSVTPRPTLLIEFAGLAATLLPPTLIVSNSAHGACTITVPMSWSPGPIWWRP